MSRLRVAVGIGCLLACCIAAYFSRLAVLRSGERIVTTNVGRALDVEGAELHLPRVADPVDDGCAPLAPDQRFVIDCGLGGVDGLRVSLAPDSTVTQIRVEFGADTGHRRAGKDGLALLLDPSRAWSGGFVDSNAAPNGAVLVAPASKPQRDGAELELALGNGTLTAEIDHALVARALFEGGDLRGTRIVVVGGKLRLARASLVGVGADKERYEVSDGFDGLPAKRANKWVAFDIALLMFLALLGVVFGPCFEPEYDGAAASLLAMFSVGISTIPLTIGFIVHANAPSSVSALALLVLAIVSGMLAAWRESRDARRVHRIFSRNTSKGGRIVAGATIVAIAISAYLATSPPRTHGATSKPVDGVPSAHHDASQHWLDPSNAVVIPGPYSDFEMRFTVATTWNSILETRFSGAGDSTDALAFVVGTDPRVRTGFRRESGTLEPIGIDGVGPQPRKLLNVRLRAIGDRFEAYVVDPFGTQKQRDDAAVLPIASATWNSRPAIHAIQLLAAKGSTRVDSIDVEPLPRDATTPTESNTAPLSKRLRLPFVILLAGFLIARGRKGSLNEAVFLLLPCGLFCYQIAIAKYPAATGTLVGREFVLVVLVFIAAFVMARAVLFARSSNTDLLASARAGGICIAMSVLVALMATLLRFEGRGALVEGTAFDFPGRRFEPDLSLLTHAPTRRGLRDTWLQDHRFHGSSITERKANDPYRVMLFGDANAIASDATPGARSEIATLLERGIEFGVEGRGAQVVDATWSGANLSAITAMLENVVLAPIETESTFAANSPPTPAFAPDLAIVVLTPHMLEGARIAALSAAAAPNAFRTMLDEVSAECDVLSSDRGREHPSDAVDSVHALIGMNLVDPDELLALYGRVTNLLALAAKAHCKIAFVIAPIERLSVVPRFWLGRGVDLFAPAIPRVAAGAATGFLDSAVLSHRGRLIFVEQLARFVRKRYLAGRGS